jgi:hypothetical protein
VSGHARFCFVRRDVHVRLSNVTLTFSETALHAANYHLITRDNARQFGHAGQTRAPIGVP